MGQMRSRFVFVGALAALLMAAGAAAQAQVPHVSVSVSVRPLAPHVIVPQRRAFAVATAAAAPTAPAAVQITGVKVGVVILEQAATTTMVIDLKNPTGRRLEAELVVPVPDGAAVRGFTFQGTASEPTAVLLTKEEARRTYEAIVAKVRDPALLEFVGLNLIRSSVFPVEANGTQKVSLTYEHLLTADGDRVDYVLPRTDAIDYTVPWHVSVKVTSKRPIATVYSPSHKLETVRADANTVSVRIAEDAVTEPGAFRLSYLLERGAVSASLFAYPDAKTGGGYFLLLAGLPAKPPRGEGPGIRREVTLVFDRSGSMRDQKIEQVREAALQIIGGLEDGEAFNIIAYNEAVDLLASKPVLKSAETMARAREYLKTLTASGGTNIHDALLEALRQKPADGMLPIVLFLTDGLPTVGQTSEVAIRNVATKANPYHRRIFTFGVGVDVNVPLLDKLATETRATSTYVLPKEDVEVKVGQVFKRLSGPILASPTLVISRPGAAEAPPPAYEVIPAQVPDLFEGDQLVLLGRYRGEEPLAFALSGNYLGKARTFRFDFPLEKSTVKNGFVPRLWASRKIGVLVDAIRQLGADGGAMVAQRGPAVPDPRVKELVDEIVRLSTEFGILTEYTAFLAREGTDLSQRDQVLSQANSNFITRAQNTRVGMGAFNQSLNNEFNQNQLVLNGRNRFFDERMNSVEVTSVQQINDRAFFNRNGRWVDSRIVEQEAQVKPAQVIEFGSKEFAALLSRLTSEGRNGAVSLQGDVLMEVDGRPVLVKAAQ